MKKRCALCGIPIEPIGPKDIPQPDLCLSCEAAIENFAGRFPEDRQAEARTVLGALARGRSSTPAVLHDTDTQKIETLRPKARE